MGTSFLNQWFSGVEVKAVCWTLIHSLWIGFVIALLCGTVLGTTRKSAAALRYRLLCGLLVLFVFSMAVTYGIEVRSSKLPALPAPPPVTVMIGAGASLSQQVETVLNRSIVDRTSDFLNQNANIIFLGWLAFFFFKSLRMVSGLLHIQRIRNYKTHIVSEELKHRIEFFSGQIGIRQTVSLLQSELVKVPAAVGWLKPVILLPIGIVFQLTPEQLDGILWHELAHIRRRDYLVNILQGLVETVFFFNPGLLWLSSLIRAEREACCDDMVLCHVNQKANYLEALLSFGYGGFNQTGYAMSIGSGNQLRSRLKRMINQENKRLGVVEKVILVAGIVLLSAFVGLTKANKKYARHFSNTATEKVVPNVNKMSPAVGIASMRKNIKTMMPGTDTMTNKADTSIQLFDRRYEWSRSEPGITYYLSAQDVAGNKYHFTLTHSTVTRDKLVAMTINGNEIQKRDLPKYMHLFRHIPPPPPPPPPHIPPPPVHPGASPGKADTAAHFAGVKNMQQDKPQPPVPPTPPSLDKMIADVTNDLVNENILKDKNSLLTFKLTNTALVVNGMKQPDDIQKKLGGRYLKNTAYPVDSRLFDNPNYGLYYNARTHGVALGAFNIDLDAL